eukprot:scaffold482_cov266-Amphora_coffeaeformis.AAC.19
MHEGGSELSQTAKAQIGIADQCRSVLIAIGGTGGDDGEGIVRRCHTGRLDSASEDVIDKGRFATGMIAHQ